MRSLRLRIAAILIGAIVVVVLVATFALLAIVNRPDAGRMVWAVASQIGAIESFYDQRAASRDIDAGVDNLGAERPDLTAALRERLLATNVGLPVTVYDKADDDIQIAVISLADRTLGIEFPANPPLPRELWLVLASWLGLIVLGVIAVSLVMADRVTRPFAMLEDAVNAVGSDGLLPHIPERGSSEARHTAAALNRLSDRLRHAMDSRMRLVAAAGHDLRTPMTRMRIRAEFLGDEDRIGWSRDIDELERIADSAITLVKEEVSTGESTPVPIDTVLREVVEELRAQHHAITLGPVDATDLAKPPLATRRMLRNLLVNAATHGKGGTVSLAATPAAVVIVIHDQGPGIPPDLLSQVFEPFFRAAPGRIHTVPGAGLGLAIANEIAERIGGTLTISNNPAGGLTQTLRFPL